jgi:hypothetical protein
MSFTKKKELTLNVDFYGLKEGEALPKTALYLLDSTGKVKQKVASVVQGKVTLEEGLMADEQNVVAFGPDEEDLAKLSPEVLVQFRVGDQVAKWREVKVVDIDKNSWTRWITFKVCVSGRVRKCVSPVFAGTIEKAISLKFVGVQKAAENAAFLKSKTDSPFTRIRRCFPICNGIVEVYARECCFDIIDVSDLSEKLKVEVVRPPKHIPRPPPPPPPPDGLSSEFQGRLSLSQIGHSVRRLSFEPQSLDVESLLFEPTLDQDIRALENLAPDEAIKYVLERPHLYYFIPGVCTEWKVGEVPLGPDGKFTFCYKKYPSPSNCRTTYFYRIKQWKEDKWVYIYGYPVSTKRQYFRDDQFADLTTSEGYACPESTPQVPHDKPFVMLTHIGATKSYELVSSWKGKDSAHMDKTQIGDENMDSPPVNGGLVHEAPPGSAAPPDSVPTSPADVSDYRTVDPSWLFNCPWAKDLRLFIYFDPLLQAPPVEAYYYRISVQSATNGSPDGNISEILTTPISWLRFVPVSGQPPQVKAETLGPMAPVGGQSGLYRIPFPEWDGVDMKWLSNFEYGHGVWNTHDLLLPSANHKFPNGKYLVGVEVFNKSGVRLNPTDGKFYYLRWLKETGADSVSKVLYPKLQHLFCIDNDPCVANIEDLRKNSMPSSEECQFLTGPSSSLFSAGFRAYHETIDSLDPPYTYMYYYTIFYHRGLGGPTRAIQTGGRNKPSNNPAAPPAQSHALSFGEMLGSNAPGSKCTFALNLRVYAKHTNGSRRIWEFDAEDQAAFALEIGA